MPNKQIVQQWQTRVARIEKQEREWTRILSEQRWSEYEVFAQRNIERLAQVKALVQHQIEQIERETAE